MPLVLTLVIVVGSNRVVVVVEGTVDTQCRRTQVVQRQASLIGWDIYVAIFVNLTEIQWVNRSHAGCEAQTST